MPTPAPFEVAMKKISQPADRLVVSARGSRCRSRPWFYHDRGFLVRDVTEAGAEGSLPGNGEFAHTARVAAAQPGGEE